MDQFSVIEMPFSGSIFGYQNHTSVEYEIPVYENYRTDQKVSKRGKSLHTEENRKKAARRAKGVFIDKVDSPFAFLPQKHKDLVKKGWRLRFLTLTYREAMEDRGRLAKDFKKFMKRLETYFVQSGLCTQGELESIYYAAVPEIQKERAQRTGKNVWHLHILLFSPYTSLKETFKVWGLGG